MFKNYFRVAWRNISRNRYQSLLNISSISIGLASCLIIAVFVMHELSYDQFHANAENIYRVVAREGDERTFNERARTSALLGPDIISGFPEIEIYTRIFKDENVYLGTNGKQFREEKFFYADSTFFDLFSFNLVQGDPGSALTTPGSVVLTRESAIKYFGSDQVIGKVI